MVSKPKKRQVGRPRYLKAAEKRETIVRVLTTEAEHKELKEAAAAADTSVSTWVRGVALERARALAAEKESAVNQDKK
jgi:delta 1-pyrroline-5-carboxylate dehydrogenase